MVSWRWQRVSAQLLVGGDRELVVVRGGSDYVLACMLILQSVRIVVNFTCTICILSLRYRPTFVVIPHVCSTNFNVVC